MNVKPEDLIAKFQYALDNGWGYVWGMIGQVWTQAKQDKTTHEMTKKYGQKWVGKQVADCSGLFYWAFKSLGSYMYHGSNTMFKKYSVATGRMSGGRKSTGEELLPATAVFKYNDEDGYYHVGLYIGDGKVIEAKGTQYGVVQSKATAWTFWAELKNVDYGHEINDLDNLSQKALGSRVLRVTSPFMSGTDVLDLQRRLIAKGYDVGPADGIYGSKTRLAVKAWQADNHLQTDGVFGEQSYHAMSAQTTAEGVTPDSYQVKVKSWSVNIRSSPELAEKANVVRVARINTILNVAGVDATGEWYRLTDGNYVMKEFTKKIY